MASPSLFPFEGGFTTQNDKLTFLAELIPWSILFCHSTEIGKKFIYLAAAAAARQSREKMFWSNLKRVGIKAGRGVLTTRSRRWDGLANAAVDQVLRRATIFLQIETLQYYNSSPSIL